MSVMLFLGGELLGEDWWGLGLGNGSGSIWGV